MTDRNGLARTKRCHASVCLGFSIPLCSFFLGFQTSAAGLKNCHASGLLGPSIVLYRFFMGSQTSVAKLKNCHAPGLLGFPFCCVGFSWGLRLLLQMQRWLPRWRTCWLQTRVTPAASSPSCTSCTATPQMLSKYLQCTFCSIPRCGLCPILRAFQLIACIRHTAACRCPSFPSGFGCSTCHKWYCICVSSPRGNRLVFPDFWAG